MRCIDYDETPKTRNENGDDELTEHLCDYCSMRTTNECDGKGNMNVPWEDSIAYWLLLLFTR
jgi:hypothetical protein